MDKDGIYILLAGLWVAYYAMHSLLASNAAKRFIYSHLRWVWRFYRIIYNVFAVAGLISIFFYQWTLPEKMIVQTSAWMLCTGALIMFLGILIGAMAFLNFNKSEFLGLQQLKGKRAEKEKLITTGLYGLVRHPLYFSLILIITGYLLYSFHLSNLIFVCTTFIYLLIGTKLEEKKLIEAFGRDYLIYRQKVKMLIPFIF